MFGNGDNLTGGAGAQNIMKYMMMSQMCKNMGGGDMNPMMMMMFMNGGGFGDMFNNIFSAMTPPTLAPKTTETETDKEDK